ncbi:MAG: hypothetical protein IJT83_06090 [Victivallales bacterium]|nr:hypothetical protein [Victivallales bacterium]
MRDNFSEIDWLWVTDVSSLQGTAGWNVLMKAREYLIYQSWLRTILDEFFACKLGDGTYVFLFEIDSYKDDVDRFVWVIHGNVPPLYLTTDCCLTPKYVAETYCDLAEQWCDGTLPELNFSVRDVPDDDVKAELRRRIASLKKSIRLHSFKPYGQKAKLSDNPHRRLERECCGSHIILRAEHLPEDLRFAAIHDVRAICPMPWFSLSHVLELADDMKVRRLDVVNCTGNDFIVNGSIEDLHWTTAKKLPECLDYSSFANLRHLSINVHEPANVRIVAPQVEEVTFFCHRGPLHVNLSSLEHLRSMTCLTSRIEFLLPNGVQSLLLAGLTAKTAEKLEFTDTLRELEINEGTLTSLDFLNKFPALTHLRLYGLSKLPSLDGLRGLPLKKLVIDTCNSIADYSPLGDLPLEELTLRRHASKPLSNIQFISTILTLEMCHLDAKVTDSDLSPLNKLKYCDYKGILTPERRTQNRQYLVAKGWIDTWFDKN